MRNYLRRFGASLVVVLALLPVSAAVNAAEIVKLIDSVGISTVLQDTGTARVIVTFKLEQYDALNAVAIARKKAVVKAAAGLLERTNALQAEKTLAASIHAGVRRVLDSVSSGAITTQHVFSSIPAAVLRVDNAGLSALEASDHVASIQLDKPHALPKPGASQAGAPSAASNYGTSLIGADQAWARGYTGQGWYVAILDTGILTTHEYFAGRDIVEACFTSKSNFYNPTTSLCPDGSGSQTGAGAAAPYASSVANYDHGVHVAGVAAGYKDASLSGVAKDAGIIAVKVFSDGFTVDGDAACRAFDSDIIRGLEYVYSLFDSYPIAAVNLSLGSGVYSETCDSEESAYVTVAENLTNVGIAVIASAGNSGYCNAVGSPGCVSSVIAVGASDSNDVKASFSNWQEDIVRLFAPGVAILSSGGASDTSYKYGNGTSAAAPFVTGAWAILKQAMPDAGVEEILEALEDTAKPVTFAPDDACYVAGAFPLRIAVEDALGETVSADIFWNDILSGRSTHWFE